MLLVTLTYLSILGIPVASAAWLASKGRGEWKWFLLFALLILGTTNFHSSTN